MIANRAIATYVVVQLTLSETANIRCALREYAQHLRNEADATAKLSTNLACTAREYAARIEGYADALAGDGIASLDTATINRSAA